VEQVIVVVRRRDLDRTSGHLAIFGQVGLVAWWIDDFEIAEDDVQAFLDCEEVEAW
jgi:hypothetical protein